MPDEGILHASAVSTGGTLTLQVLREAIQAVYDQPYPEPHRHLVSGGGERAIKSGSWTLCVECGSPLGNAPDHIIEAYLAATLG